MLVLAGLTAVAVFGDSVYIFPEFTAPGHPASPTFTYTGSGGYLLTLDGSKMATSASLVGSISQFITQALVYAGHNGIINSGESSATSPSRINSEVGTMDDAVFVADGIPDEDLNIDYGAGASVFFSIPSQGVSALLIAEDGGLDPFRLRHCTGISGSPGSTTGVGCTDLFYGWSNTVQNTLVTGSLGLEDTGEIDQQFLFVFNSAKNGYFEIREIGDPGNNSKLEVDFVGVHTVPEPGYYALLTAGLAGVLLLRRFGARRP